MLTFLAFVAAFACMAIALAMTMLNTSSSVSTSVEAPTPYLNTNSEALFNQLYTAVQSKTKPFEFVQDTVGGTQYIDKMVSDLRRRMSTQQPVTHGVDASGRRVVYISWRATVNGQLREGVLSVFERYSNRKDVITCGNLVGSRFGWHSMLSDCELQQAIDLVNEGGTQVLAERAHEAFADYPATPAVWADVTLCLYTPHKGD